MKVTILKTENSWSGFIGRTILGTVIFAHGAQKLFGWFGGYGFEGIMEYFTLAMGLPWLVGFLVVLLEFFGAILLLVGFGTRLIAAGFTALAIGIVFSSHIQNGFFMNWEGTQSGEGYEFFLLWIAISCAITIEGAGKYSVDGWLLRKRVSAYQKDALLTIQAEA